MDTFKEQEKAEPSLRGDIRNKHKGNQLHSCLAARGKATCPCRESRPPVPAGTKPGEAAPPQHSQVGQEAALVPEQAAVPEPDEENQVRPSRLRFGPGDEGKEKEE